MPASLIHGDGSLTVGMGLAGAALTRSRLCRPFCATILCQEGCVTVRPPSRAVAGVLRRVRDGTGEREFEIRIEEEKMKPRAQNHCDGQ